MVKIHATAKSGKPADWLLAACQTKLQAIWASGVFRIEPALTSMTRPLPLSRDEFDLFRSLETRWSDNDLYGHMNNVVHYQMFDTAINGWLIDAGLLDLDAGEIAGLVVETGCNYFSEIRFPDRVTAGIRIGHLGNSSVRYEIALFPNEAEEAAAQGHFVHVYIDRVTRKPTPLPQSWRAVFGELAT